MVTKNNRVVLSLKETDAIKVSAGLSALIDTMSDNQAVTEAKDVFRKIIKRIDTSLSLKPSVKQDERET